MNNSQVIESVPLRIPILGLEKSFKIYFNAPSRLQYALEYMSSTSEVMADVKDAQSLPPNTFPFVLFYDEMETGNPLGSHKGVHKIGMFYVGLRCMPPNQYSKLENIIILACVPYKATKEIDHVLEYIVEEMNSLYINGITIKNKRIRFKMIGLVGDNLGQHQILGFTQSFRANHYCIRCKAHRDTCQKMCKLDVGLLRNDENYEEDVRINDLSQTGVARNCVFNKVYDYNVTNDIIFDIMHDLLEGVCNFGMCGVLKKLIKLPGINLNVINNRLECFDFGAHANRPLLLDANQIEKMDLGMSASEMCNLVMYFSLIVGDLVPIDTPVWEYYLTLQLILDIILPKSIKHQTISYLESLITIHHSLYLEHFGLLEPKCHNMLHYAECLR